MVGTIRHIRTREQFHIRVSPACPEAKDATFISPLGPFDRVTESNTILNSTTPWQPADRKGRMIIEATMQVIHMVPPRIVPGQIFHNVHS